ncbi:MAG: hypothetical protein U0802_24035 [Candidatus Binatia bacterium]
MRVIAGILFAFASSSAALAQLPVAKSFAPPAVTTWRPLGCRLAQAPDPVLPPRARWHNLHGDAACSDEVAIALPAVLRTDWTAEAATYNVTGPVFDRAGNLYFSPLIPYENVVLVSLDPSSGARRWAVPGTGAPAGGSTPMVLADPDHAGAEIVYLALY